MIPAVVVDTDVVSFVFKQDSRASLYAPHLDDRLLVISFMTLAELHQWTLLRNWGARRRAELEEYLKQYVIVHSDPSLCLSWGQIGSESAKTGRPIGAADAWIAATALTYGIPLVTHNSSDYGGVSGLTILSAS